MYLKYYGIDTIMWNLCFIYTILLYDNMVILFILNRASVSYTCLIYVVYVQWPWYNVYVFMYVYMCVYLLYTHGILPACILYQNLM
jgi:hypothetical protein